ncbi:MAG: YbhB/YbcL family Raf kinase inhibitor-like protein [Candidatus Komeilibacteria bacterium CG11_big_fil_rev_8_21_14_0_20_36_20]|uniref:YbhB/YbcL family Raf kinase inhibitor-like protein n=1 Tax=Candidatus Komeilibacteria bacterium CG11_big_fil_rev_8_21_14_0_20_36_20 TaxID=1974477 RepID=A0A2H0NEK4_9BACT|nr:MAG: YbhB/YbcL family Raf kinase inhibitor-like protein [Candidatus Komeilibacteria bacterium CG11_big_fil_rev_8_21_14_0_20_36_20]PIR81544.1 MAG: YbhB/YbcL family Raf kinase inhibitor-like protein [Candidatus Komeilibacteria bacterium CG10_big_fil_rev_8_21_14_0_10_36_65]PJC55452.1 MAG: YbhB/YbcL family Raf kinase inhibitor-like protein [Candidatus Komeilibacteria bacterium CG_4_9_14_0_2_um_filter_36_13]
MKITSPAFGNNQSIPRQYTCDGENINPPLEFLEVPVGTKSLVLIMEDPDVPKYIREDGRWDHWLIWNIPPETKNITENSTPPGLVGLNTSGRTDYVSPCPPDREHRYFFKLYALKTTLDLPAGSTKADLLAVMQAHIIDQAELIGLYQRI